MSVAEWPVVVGLLLILMALAGTLLGRLPLSSAMVYLVLGCLLGSVGCQCPAPPTR
jgi:Kef-type K+ transport system membrane component KefB